MANNRFGVKPLQEETSRVNIVVYSDYLCPWCYIAAVRLQRIVEEYGERVSVTWRSFPLLLGEIHESRSRARAAQSWRRAGEEETSICYNPWPESSPVPTSSIPAQEAAKCAALQGEQAFKRLHLLLLRAFFEQNRDISNRDVLLSLAEEAGLDRERFIPDFDSGSQREQVLADYRRGRDDPRFSGVPTAIFNDQFALEGAVPIEMYRRAIDILLQRGG